MPETELLRRWRPNGKFSQTGPPEVKIEAGQVFATCATEGAVIGWTAVPPNTQPANANNPFAEMGKAVGNPEMDGRFWQLYNGPFAVPNGRILWFLAHRLGYLQSEEVTLDLSNI